MKTFVETVVRNDKLYRRTITEEAIRFDQSIYSEILNTEKNGLLVKDLYQNNIHWGRSKDMTDQHMIISKMNSVRLDTYYTLFDLPDSENPIIVPTYSDKKDSLRFDLVATFDNDVDNYFITFHYAAGIVYKCHMVCMVDGEMYMPPFPNIHDDGMFCMGDYYQVNKEMKTALDHHCDAVEYISDSQFNTDLYNRQRCSIPRFEEVSASAWKCLPITAEKIKQKSSIISNNDLQCLQNL